MTNWKRKGHCSQCGACCKSFAFVIPDLNKDDKEYFSYRKNVSIDDEKKMIEIFISCNNLTKDNKCAIYNNRPQFCKEYPSKPSELVEGCTYYFVEEEE